MRSLEMGRAGDGRSQPARHRHCNHWRSDAFPLVAAERRALAVSASLGDRRRGRMPMRAEACCVLPSTRRGSGIRRIRALGSAGKNRSVAQSLWYGCSKLESRSCITPRAVRVDEPVPGSRWRSIQATRSQQRGLAQSLERRDDQIDQFGAGDVLALAKRSRRCRLRLGHGRWASGSNHNAARP